MDYINKRLVISVLLFFTLIGCGGGSSGGENYETQATNTGYGTTTTTTDDASTATFETSLSLSIPLVGAQQVPRVNSNKTATASIDIDEGNLLIRGEISVSNITTATMAHIHSGRIGQNGAVLMVFENDGYGKFILQQSELTEELLAIIKGGGTHVNLHTSDYPDGELRGQIVMDSSSLFSFAVSGAQEVPRTSETGSGTGYSRYDTDGSFETRLSLVNISDVNAVHIHTGAVGINGDVLVALEQDPDNQNGWKTPDDLTINSGTATVLVSGGHYVNVHSSTFPSGALRGQIITSPNAVVAFELTGDQQVPAVTTTATGDGYALVNTATGALVARIILDGISSVTAVHIHQGEAGMNGDVVVALTQSADDGNLWQTPSELLLDAATLALLLDNGHYINVHTSDYPDGEIRGQITAN